jgi:hypothetical protein
MNKHSVVPPSTPKPSRPVNRKHKKQDLSKTTEAPTAEPELISSTMVVGEGLMCVDNNLANSTLVIQHVQSSLTEQDVELLADIQTGISVHFDDHKPNDDQRTDPNQPKVDVSSSIVEPSPTKRGRRVVLSSSPTKNNTSSKSTRSPSKSSKTIRKPSTVKSRDNKSEAALWTPTEKDKLFFEDSAKFTSVNSIRPAETTKVISTASTNKSRPPNTGQAAKSKMEETFSKLTKLMPTFKLDKRMRESIVQSLKEINCWSDDEGETKSAKRSLKTASIDCCDDKFGPNSPNSPLRIDTSQSDRISSAPISLTQPTAAVVSLFEQPGPTLDKHRATLIKPKQIPDSPALLSLEAKKKSDRETVRERVVQQAIHLLVEIRKEHDETKHLNVVSLLKEQSSTKVIAIKRTSYGLVDRALKKAKHHASMQ